MKTARKTKKQQHCDKTFKHTLQNLEGRAPRQGKKGGKEVREVRMKERRKESSCEGALEHVFAAVNVIL